MPKTATQHDIARLAGVSHMTVSRALRGHPDVQEVTRQRIEELAAKHGYRANAGARAMRKGRYGALGLLMSEANERSALLPDLVAGIRTAMRSRSLHLVLGDLPDGELASNKRLPQLLQEWSVDGLIVHYTHDAPEELAEMLRRYKLPAVWTNTTRDVHCITPDDRSAARELAEKAFANGHRKAMYLDVINSHHPSVPDRRDGFIGRFTELGGSVRVRIVEPGSVWQTSPTIRAWTEETFERLGDTTLVVSYRPVDACRVMHIAQQHGRRVPQDLSFATFSIRRELFAGLTELAMYQVPTERLGREAVDMLCRRIDDADHNAEPKPIPAQRLPLNWIEGDTFGPAPSGSQDTIYPDRPR
ncbi:MAG: LacI family DNA-binding transcriptional regulator [Planctomycetota bacterium]